MNDTYRLSACNNLLISWVNLRQRGASLASLLIKLDIRTVAVCGAGVLGVLLANELYQSDVEVKCGIDSSSGCIDFAPPVFAVDSTSEMPEFEGIIVTAFWDFENQRRELEKSFSCRIIALDDLIYSAIALKERVYE